MENLDDLSYEYEDGDWMRWKKSDRLLGLYIEIKEQNDILESNYEKSKNKE